MIAKKALLPSRHSTHAADTGERYPPSLTRKSLRNCGTSRSVVLPRRYSLNEGDHGRPTTPKNPPPDWLSPSPMKVADSRLVAVGGPDFPPPAAPPDSPSDSPLPMPSPETLMSRSFPLRARTCSSTPSFLDVDAPFRSAAPRKRIMSATDMPTLKMMLPPPSYDPSMFLSRPTAEMLCTYCNKVLSDPLRSECGHVFCRGCLAKMLSEANDSANCPMDSAPLQLLKPAQNIKSLVQNAEVKCKYFSNGCSFTTRLSQIEAHHASCTFTEDSTKSPLGCQNVFRESHHSPPTPEEEALATEPPLVAGEVTAEQLPIKARKIRSFTSKSRQKIASATAPLMSKMSKVDVKHAVNAVKQSDLGGVKQALRPKQKQAPTEQQQVLEKRTAPVQPTDHHGKPVENGVKQHSYIDLESLPNFSRTAGELSNYISLQASPVYSQVNKKGTKNSVSACQKVDETELKVLPKERQSLTRNFSSPEMRSMLPVYSKVCKVASLRSSVSSPYIGVSEAGCDAALSSDVDNQCTSSDQLLATVQSASSLQRRHSSLSTPPSLTIPPPPVAPPPTTLSPTTPPPMTPPPMTPPPMTSSTTTLSPLSEENAIAERERHIQEEMNFPAPPEGLDIMEGTAVQNSGEMSTAFIRIELSSKKGFSSVSGDVAGSVWCPFHAVHGCLPCTFQGTSKEVDDHMKASYVDHLLLLLKANASLHRQVCELSNVVQSSS